MDNERMYLALKACVQIMVDDLTDAQRQELVVTLQNSMVTNELSKDLLDRTRWMHNQAPYEDVEELKISFKNELSDDYRGYDYTQIKWDWIYKELTK